MLLHVVRIHHEGTDGIYYEKQVVFLAEAAEQLDIIQLAGGCFVQIDQQGSEATVSMGGEMLRPQGFAGGKLHFGVRNPVLSEQLAEASSESAAVYYESFVFRGGQKIIDSGLHGTCAGCSVVDEATTFLQPDVLPKPAHAFLHKSGVFSCAEIGDFLLVYISGARVWLYRTDGEKFHDDWKIRCWMPIYSNLRASKCTARN